MTIKEFLNFFYDVMTKHMDVINLLDSELGMC